MKRSTKVLVTTVAVVGITAASFSFVSARGGWGGCEGPYAGMGRGGDYSQTNRGPGSGWGSDGTRLGRMESRMQDRMDYMKYKLQITAEQEPAWSALTDSVKKKVSSKVERFSARRDGDFTIKDKVELMREGSADLQSLADSIENLYAQLTPEQQRIADDMGPMFGRHGGRGR